MGVEDRNGQSLKAGDFVTLGKDAKAYLDDTIRVGDIGKTVEIVEVCETTGMLKLSDCFRIWWYTGGVTKVEAPTITKPPPEPPKPSVPDTNGVAIRLGDYVTITEDTKAYSSVNQVLLPKRGSAHKVRHVDIFYGVLQIEGIKTYIHANTLKKTKPLTATKIAENVDARLATHVRDALNNLTEEGTTIMTNSILLKDLMTMTDAEIKSLHPLPYTFNEHGDLYDAFGRLLPVENLVKRSQFKALTNEGKKLTYLNEADKAEQRK